MLGEKRGGIYEYWKSPMHEVLPFHSSPSPSSPFHIFALREPFLSSMLMLHALIKVSLYTWGYQLWVLSCTTQCCAYGGYSESVALAEKWYCGSIQLKSDVFQVYTVILSMACDLILSLKTAFQSCGTYSFIVKEAKLWL